jgi:hypothetical protein
LERRKKMERLKFLANKILDIVGFNIINLLIVSLMKALLKKKILLRLLYAQWNNST